MGDIDYKGIGLAAKDLIVGIAAAGVGAGGGGSAGAEGVMKAGSGLDKILAMAGVEEDKKKETPADKFDRGGPKKAPPTPAPSVKPDKLAQADPAPAPSSNKEGEGPLEGDTRVSVDHLRELGWSRIDIQKILAGPEQTSITALTNPTVGGGRLVGAKGSRVAQVGGSAVPIQRGQAGKLTTGDAIPTIQGRKVSDDEIA